jgi:hypothetical protein
MTDAATVRKRERLLGVLLLFLLGELLFLHGFFRLFLVALLRVQTLAHAALRGVVVGRSALLTSLQVLQDIKASLQRAESLR